MTEPTTTGTTKTAIAELLDKLPWQPSSFSAEDFTPVTPELQKAIPLWKNNAVAIGDRKYYRVRGKSGSESIIRIHPEPINHCTSICNLDGCENSTDVFDSEGFVGLYPLKRAINGVEHIYCFCSIEHLRAFRVAK